jgi:DNA-binding CsgD family transcriptional regulator
VSGHGNLVLIGGEAGIGKTALAEAFCREAADRGALVLVGRCYDLTETPPYGPWVELFGQYPQGDDLPALPAPFAHGGTVGEISNLATLFQQVRDFCAGLTARQPTVLLFDDLHWADPASLDLLRVVARQLMRCPILAVVTYRSEAVDTSHPLYALRPALVREAPTERLELRPLPDGAVHALIDRRYALSHADAKRLSEYVQQRADGNPFFIGEILRSLQEAAVLQQTAAGWLLDSVLDVGVPALVRQVIGLRIRRLDAEVQRFLAIAAVIGQEVPVAIWQRVAEMDDESMLTAIERAEAAHLIAGARDGTRVRFVHALIRETLYEEMTAARRRHWHLRAGEVLAAMPVSDADAVAYHFAQAGDERAVTWLVRAGDVAQRAYAWLTAANRYETALAHLDATSETSALQARLHFRAAMLIQHDDPARAIEHIDVVQRFATLHDDRALLAHALWYRGTYQVFAGALESGLTDLAAGVAAMDALPSADATSRGELDGIVTMPQGARRTLVLQLARAGRIAEAIANEKKLQILYRATVGGSGRKTEDVSPLLGIAYALLGQPEAAQAAIAANRSTYAANEAFLPVGSTFLNQLRMVALTYQADDLTGRRHLAQDGEQAWAQSIGVTPDLPPRFCAVPLLLVEGHWSEARELALAVCNIKVAEMRAQAMSMLGSLACTQGDAALAWAQVHAFFPDGPATRPGTVRFFDALILQRLASVLALDAGDTATARTWLVAHDAWLAWNGAVLGVADGQLAWASYYRKLGDAAQARACADRALGSASEPRQPLALFAAHRLLGELDTDAGRFANATQHFDASLALADACAAPYERALALVARAELHAASGQRDVVLPLLDEVRRIAAPLHTLPLLARADALTARFDRAKATAPHYPAGLSAREIAVLRLVAAGRTNEEIAAALSISRHTVIHHVTHILAKTQSDNRVAAAAYALRHDLI